MRGMMVASYLLVWEGRAVLIDGGFVGQVGVIGRGLAAAGLDWGAVEAVLLTHGHLDHTLNVAEIVRRSGARVLAHERDLEHVAGRYAYRGWARGCGALEAVGRVVLGYRAPRLDGCFEDGSVLPYWGGLRVVHLPGHTEGHCGFYSVERDLLFAGDLFATGRWRTFLPYFWMNSAPERMGESLGKARRLGAKGILCNHCDRARGGGAGGAVSAEVWWEWRSGEGY